MAQLAVRLVKLLRTEKIELAHYDQLSKEDQAQVRAEYVRSIYPLVTPQSVDPAHPFPFVSNLKHRLSERFETKGKGCAGSTDWA